MKLIIQEALQKNMQLSRGGNNMIVWMAVTSDELELPFAVADTAAELGKMLGMKSNCVSRTLCLHNKNKTKKWKKYKIVKVVCEND